MNALRPFHVAVPVHNLEECRAFYRDILGCREGRSDSNWVDFDLYGHQLVIHHKPGQKGDNHHNPVDGHNVPVPHYGVVLSMEEWEILAGRLKDYGVQFIIEPYIRFKGGPGEQATLFFLDPAGNALEFKAFHNIETLFATE